MLQKPEGNMAEAGFRTKNPPKVTNMVMPTNGSRESIPVKSLEKADLGDPSLRDTSS